MIVAGEPWPRHGSGRPWRKTGMVLICTVFEQVHFAWPKVQDGTMRPQQGAV